jgi:hypothetical protein
MAAKYIVNDCCLMPKEHHFLSYTMTRTSYMRRDDVSFVLDQHT